MELVIYSLRTIAKAIIEPTYLLVLIVFGLIFYLKNKKTSIIQQMTIGEVIDTPLELTLSQLVIGILAGTIGSVILAILGISFGNNSGIEFIFITSILLLMIRPKLACFAYSGALLGAVSIILNILLNSVGMKSYINVNILSLSSFIAVLHMIEGIIVMVDGSRGSIPIFSNRDNKIIGGFSFNRYWAMPIAVMIMISGESSGTGIISIPTYSWWPIIKDSNLITMLATASLMFTSFYGIIGYSSVTFTKRKKEKVLGAGIGILLYGLSLLIVSQLCSIGLIGEILTLVYMPLAHELLIKLERMKEERGEYLYVSGDDGISILEVAPNSIAFEAGIRRGDKILAINNEPVNSEVDILKAVKEATTILPIKIKSKYGKINDYILQPGNKRLGVLLVPRMVKSESKIDIDSDEFKRILEELKSKK
ncbi:MAG: PDZ domain-containing protein [Clostridium sp.]|nr:PDZ domain-containing protein [Clostridium sp.]